MKRNLLFLICILFYTTLFAQKSDKEKAAYAEKAAQLQTQIWSNNTPEFTSTTIPANLSKESAVVLARSYSLSRASSGKLKFGASIGITTRTTKFSIFHERVKINDKTALESFSTLEYQKILNKTTSQLFAKFVNENNTFIGAKVIKPSGKELIVNTNEEVLVKDDTKDKKGKLAIPDLQVGDILDYYISREDVADKEEGNTYKDNDNIIFLVDEYPVLYYAIDFQYNKKINVKTIYANGAQHFDESKNSEGDQLLSLKLHNIPKYESQLWVSALREYPYIEIGSSYKDDLDDVIRKNKYDGDNALFLAQKHTFETSFAEYMFPYATLTAKVRDYFKDRKSIKNASQDSIAKVLFAQWQYSTFCTFFPKDIEDFSSHKYSRASSLFNTINMTMALTDLKIDFDVLLVSSRYSNSLNNVFNMDDFDALIRINGDKPTYMSFDDIATHYGDLPEKFQGEEVYVLHPKRRNIKEYEFTEDMGKLPVIAADQNTIDEHLNVSLNEKDMQKLKIERSVKERGEMRHDDQKSLLGMDDVDNGLTDAAKGQGIDTRFKNYVGGKKFVAAVNDAFEKEKEGKTKYFNEEIKSKYDQEPKEVNNCKIINAALDYANPVFEYKESFVLDNLVKKAGSNYIIDAGKLTGGFLKLEEKDKKRDKNIYMPAARSFSYTIILAIPTGYAAKGVEELNKQKSNKTGSFNSSAVINGNSLTIKIIRTYNNNFEKAADWPLLLDVISTAGEFDSAKILFEKQG